MALLGRDTAVTGPFPKGVLLLETLRGQEELGRPYKLKLGLLSKEPDLDPADVLGKPLAVCIQLNTGKERFFHGIVTRFSKGGATQLHTRYAAEIRPRLSLLDLAVDCLIFNDPAQDGLSIVKTVLAKHGLPDVESGSIQDHAYRTREFCVQYRESDLRFVQRLLEEEGIYYFFRHEESKHTLVFADSITAHEAADGYESILYTAKERQVAGSEEHFWGLKVRRAVYPPRHTVLSGYDPTQMRPRRPRFGQATAEDLVTGHEFEHYDSPGGLSKPEEAQQEATARTRVCRVVHTGIDVEGNTMGLGLGNLVSLRPGPDTLDGEPFWGEKDFDKQYLVVAASYSLSVDQYETQYETNDVAFDDEPFKASYRLLDSHTQFRPQRRTRKPIMAGPQTALVVGPAGEEIWTDKLGRVMVHFDWDRRGERNEKSSCWVRVMQMWAGARWGAQYLPRVGQEVIVAFLDGDPDRPVIRGHVYNRDNMPPYDLPAHRTQSGIKSRSSKGGTASNFNEIRFEDKKAQEELHLQAEKDMSTRVKHDQTLHVGTDRIIFVGNDEANLVKNDRQLTVDVNDSVVIGGTHDKTVTGTVTQVYGGDHSRKVDGNQEFFEEKNKDEHVKQAFKLTTDKKFQLNQGATNMTFKNTNVTVDAAGTITITAGGATVCLDKTGKATFDSPTGIKFVCGASTLSILPGGVAFASPAVTAAAGAGSTVAMGEDAVAMKSKTVTVEADGVCSIKGKSALKLQEAEPVKGKKGQGAGPATSEGQSGARVDGKSRKPLAKQDPKTLQEAPERTVKQVRLVGMFFDLNKCFLLPSAMQGIRKVKEEYDANPDSNLLIVGHTDSSGDSDYNLTLSLERANAVAAYLTDKVGAWEDYFAGSKPDKKRWGLLEVQHMLSALPEGRAPYYQATPNGEDDDISKAVVTAFQNDKKLKQDGIAGPVTRNVLIEAYMGLDGTTLPAGTVLATHGCGENYPVDTTDNDVRSADDRRVEIFFFDGPVTPPPPGSTSPKGSTVYPSWLKQVTNTIDVGIAQAAGRTLRIMPVFEHDYRYTLRVGDRVYDGERTANEEIKHEVPSDATSGELTIIDKVDKVRYQWTMNMVTLDDLDTTLGMQQRLINLGYLSGKATGTENDETRQALRDFQIDSDIDPSGKYDATTQDALRRKCSPS